VKTKMDEHRKGWPRHYECSFSKKERETGIICSKVLPFCLLVGTNPPYSAIGAMERQELVSKHNGGDSDFFFAILYLHACTVLLCSCIACCRVA